MMLCRRALCAVTLVLASACVDDVAKLLGRETEDERRAREKHEAERGAEFDLRYAALTERAKTDMLPADNLASVSLACERNTACMVELRDDWNRARFVRPDKFIGVRDLRPIWFMGARHGGCFVNEPTEVCIRRLGPVIPESHASTQPATRTARLSSVFGTRKGRRHNGIDIPMDANTPIAAARDGEVKTADHDLFGYGNYVVIADGRNETLYAHLNRIMVTKGQQVTGGKTIIGLSGETGDEPNAEAGPFLHFELRVDGKAVDPVGTDLPGVQAMLSGSAAATARNVDASKLKNGWTNWSSTNASAVSPNPTHPYAVDSPSGYVHLVQPSDRLPRLAKYYGVTETSLRAVNEELFKYNESQTGHRMIINEPIALPTGCTIPSGANFARLSTDTSKLAEPTAISTPGLTVSQ